MQTIPQTERASKMKQNISKATGDRLIRLQTVMERTGLGRTSVYVMAKAGHFPKQVKLGKRAAAWSEAAVNAWVEGRKSGNFCDALAA